MRGSRCDVTSFSDDLSSAFLYLCYVNILNYYTAGQLPGFSVFAFKLLYSHNNELQHLSISLLSDW